MKVETLDEGDRSADNKALQLTLPNRPERPDGT